MLEHMKTFVVAAAVSIAAPASAAAWDIDPVHSSATFQVRHMMVSNVRGEFGKVTGTVDLDDKDIAKSSAKATIDAATINTREPKRDNHLRSPEFFDVKKYPEITFVSKSVKKEGKDKLKVSGDLTMHGVTKEVVLDVETSPRELKDPMGVLRRGVLATTKIDRRDYGLKWNKALEAGGMLVGDEVQITLDLSLTKRKEAGGAPAGRP